MVLNLSGIHFCLHICSFALICLDNHILSLSMEFEKQNIIVTEWETEKVMTIIKNVSSSTSHKKTPSF